MTRIHERKKKNLDVPCSSSWSSLLGHDCRVVIATDMGYMALFLNSGVVINHSYFCKDEDNAYKVLTPDI